jgi:hypothetical protein
MPGVTTLALLFLAATSTVMNVKADDSLNSTSEGPQSMPLSKDPEHTLQPSGLVYGTGGVRTIYAGHLLIYWNVSHLQGGISFSNGVMTIPQSGLYYIYAQVSCIVPVSHWCGSTLTVNGVAMAMNHASSQGSYGNGQTLYSGTVQNLSSRSRIYVVSRTTAKFELNPPRVYLGATRLASYVEY